MHEAEMLLDRYKRLMAPGFPFVVIEPDITAAKMWTEKPLLLHAIVTVSYFHDLEVQTKMVKSLMRDISERVLINSEKSVGILQGMLIFVSWYHPHMFWGQQITNLLHLAIGMGIDLGIDRVAIGCSSEWKNNKSKALGKAPSLEERRLYAGTFYLSSMLASSFKHFDAIPYKKYLETCLDVLQEAREYTSDSHLVQMVRIQHLIEETHTTEAPSAPIQIYAKAFGADLAKLRENDPCNGHENVFLQMEYVFAEILIWEMSLNDLLEHKAQLQHSQLDDLYHCVKTVRKFLDVFNSIPIYMYLTMPFSTFCQFGHVFFTLTKLATLELDGWDFKALHDTIDFRTAIEDAASRFENASKITPDGLSVKNESLTKWAHRIRWMKTIYENKFLSPAAKEAQFASHMHDNAPACLQNSFGEAIAVPGAQQQPTPPDDVLSGEFFNYLDENFWQNLGNGNDWDLATQWPDMSMT